MINFFFINLSRSICSIKSVQSIEKIGLSPDLFVWQAKKFVFLLFKVQLQFASVYLLQNFLITIELLTVVYKHCKQTTVK